MVRDLQRRLVIVRLAAPPASGCVPRQWRRLTLTAFMAMAIVGCFSHVPAMALAFWNGPVSGDWFDPNNWLGNEPPDAGERVAIVDPSWPQGGAVILNMPVFNGDNSATPIGSDADNGGLEIGSGGDASFTMDGGVFAVNKNVRLGNGPFLSTWTHNAGTVIVNDDTPDNGPANSNPDRGGFRVSTANGSTAQFTMNAGLLNLIGNTAFSTAGTGGGTPAGCVANLDINGGEITAGNVFLGTFLKFPFGAAVTPVTTVDMSGGVLRARDRMINFGAEAFQAELQFTMSGGLVESAGILRFLGGTFDVSGGVIRGSDLSTRSGFEMDLNGGVLEIATDVLEDEINKGVNRLLGAKFADPFPRLITSLPDHFVAITYTEDPLGPDVARAFATIRGDFDNDLDVDGNDFLVWQRELGTTHPVPELGADANGDTIVDALDLAIWQANFGKTAGVAALAVAASVPEPATFGLTLAGLLVVVGCRRSQR